MDEKMRKAIAEQTKELLARWIKDLSPEEALAWMDAHEEDLEAKMNKAQQEKADLEAVLRAARPLVDEQGGTQGTIADAMETIRRKEHKTLAEAEALDAFERIKNNPI